MHDAGPTKPSRASEAFSAISITSLIDGFRLYARTWQRALSHHRHLAARSDNHAPPIAFGASLAVFFYGIALGYVIYLPIVLWNDLAYPKLLFLVQYIYSQTMLVLAQHLGIKCVGGKGTVEDSASVLCTWMGLVFPVATAVALPFFVYHPTDDLLSQHGKTLMLPDWLAATLSVPFLCMTIVFITVALRWLATVHRISLVRSFLAWLLSFPLMWLVIFFITPRVHNGIRWIGRFLERLT
jgi:hypothetical protein